MTASAVLAHELRTEITLRPPVILVTASYAGQEPLAYAPIEIFEPGSASVEFQNGRTDARGRFAFIPHRSGEWRIVVDDELGHHRETTVTVDETFLNPAGGESAIDPSTAAVPLWWRWLTGISIILGCTGIYFWLKARRKLKENA
jgi:nickel transport protein